MTHAKHRFCRIETHGDYCITGTLHHELCELLEAFREFLRTILNLFNL